MSINLSVDELVRPDLVAFPDQLLNEYRVPAYTTVLEVTESKLVDDVNTVLAGLQAPYSHRQRVCSQSPLEQWYMRALDTHLATGLETPRDRVAPIHPQKG